MKRREFITLVGCVAASVPLAARAQRTVVSIGLLVAGAADTTAALTESLKQGLRENGLVEGKDYVLEPRFAEGHYQRFAEFAHELAERRASVILVTTIAAARAAQRATSTIPIVMTGLNDPVGNGIVASLARPGGNTTGMATLNQDITPKLVKFLHAVAPNAATAAVLFNPGNPSNGIFLKSVRDQTTPLGIAVEDFAVNTPDELNATFGKIAALRPDALLIMPDAATLDLGARIAALALQNRIPVISTDRDLTIAGGLVGYGLSRRETYRRSAYFVKKVLDGVKPADLPVEQPTRILLTINLKTARAFGLEISSSLLATADEVIE
jgi:putative ABC transport system substrate-binding protein